MKFNIYLKALLLGFAIIFIASCDKDYNEIGADVIGDNDNHYGFDVDSTKTVVAYNQATGFVQTNDLPVNALGFYNHPKFGKTTANFTTQLELASVDPDFINPSAISIDSVYLYVPYFIKSSKTVTNDDGSKTYKLDSIYGNEAKIKLSVYESTHYLRDYDPSSGFQEEQKYYSDFVPNHNLTLLNNSSNVAQNSQFFFDPAEKKITWIDENEAGTADDEVVVKERKAPGIWMDLDTLFFRNKIIEAPTGKLLNNNVFKDYFRGLYFEAEELSSSPSGAMAMLNFKQGKIVVEYEDETSATDPARKKKTLTINLAGNTVNSFVNNESSEFTAALTNADPINGDEKLYLKGQQGSIAVIDILNATEIAEMKNNNWLINEANLTFTIDKSKMSELGNLSEEPYRVYLYDLNNRRPIVDYYSDGTTNSLRPKFGKVIHGGIIDTTDAGRGIRYKIRLTNHLRNLIKNDSTNVRLGLAITESISTVSNMKLKSPITSNGTSIDRVPAAGVMNPLGTILWGTNSSVPEGKKLKLKIYYTKPE